MAPRVKGKCAYQKDWESTFSWVRPDEKNKYSAKCVLCCTTFLIDTMGRSALVSHAKGEKHKRKELSSNKSCPLDMWVRCESSNFRKSLPETQTVTSAQPLESSLSESRPTNCSPSAVQSLESCLHVSESVPSTSSSNNSCRMNRFLIQDSVTKAETIWALQTVTNHISLRAAGNCSKLFPYMFSDSEIAKKFTLQKDKLSYVILYGLCPYFKGTLNAIMSSSKFVVLGFDESHNKVAEKQQMDLAIRFWNAEESRVNSRYLTSVFLHNTSACDLLKGIEEHVPDDILNKVCQLSMDGPNVNFKVQKLFLETKRSDPEAYQLLNIGSCGLHTLHNAFKVGMAKTNWNLMGFFRAIFNLFKFSPRRRGEYAEITDSTVFPLEVCSIRWVENGAVARRALQILPNIEKYMKEVKKNGNEPSCSSFLTVCEFLADKLLVAKIAFFEGLTNEIEPFLSEYQTDSPMVPFLYNSLSVLVESAMKRIVKEDIMKTTGMHKIDVLKKSTVDSKTFENLKISKEIDLGYGTRAALRKCEGFSNKDVLIFRQDCRKALQFFIAKLMEKSPLKYPLTKAVTCFNPNYIVKGSTEHDLRVTLEKILEAKLLQTTEIEKADREYKQLCSCPVVIDRCKAFSRSETRLDEFWMEILNGKNMPNLREVVKLVLTLSHGNASIERGFSVNKEILVENLKEHSLIAQRIVYEAIKVNGGIENIELTTKLIHSVRSSHSRYKEALENQRKNADDNKKQVTEKRKAQVELKELLEKKKKLLEEANRELAVIEERVHHLKKV